MNILIAPGSFKGSLTASEVAQYIEAGCLLALPKAKITRIPMADGGDGLLNCFLANEPLFVHSIEITNPIGEKIKAPLGIRKDNIAIIEMAKASGIILTPVRKRNPLKTTSYGTGELIRAALDLGCRQFIIGLGGSATCDGGIGALAALGVQFKNHQNQEIEHNASGLRDLAHIDNSKIDPRLHSSKFILACDVDNPLAGSDGAVLYALQKGATPLEAKEIQSYLEHFASIVAKQNHKNIADIAHGGAAGGMGAGFFAFLNAELRSGAAVVIQELNLEAKIKTADFVITAEGQIDKQSIYGKTPIAIAQLAKKYSIPTIAIVAKIGNGFEQVYQHGITAMFSFINAPMSKIECFRLTKPLLSSTAYNITKLMSLSLRNHNES